jgi:hypothetical protein
MRLFLALFFSLTLTYCGSEPPSTFSKRGLICQTDGFCLNHNDDAYFYGAFRKGEQELQFKIDQWHWSPLQIIKGGGGPNICLMTEAQDTVFSGGMTCAEDRNETGGGLPPQAYKELAEQFALYLEQTSPISGREAEWRHLQQVVSNFASKV